MNDEDQFTRSDGDKTLIAGISGGALTYMPGDVIDNDYRLIKLIGRGGVGAVFSCLKISLSRKYALKLLAGAAMTGEIWTRFQTEAKLLARLNHPGIVRVHNMGIDRQQCPYYIMDLLEGESLSALVRRKGRLPLAEALDIFIQMAEALGSAHSQGITHRDIKPSNVVLVPDPKTGDATAILVDFGLARTGESDYDRQSQTATGQIFGTPAYMSPEQCQGEKVDHRSDIYSFGCSLHQALSGSAPFWGENPLQVLMMHQTKEPPDLPMDENGKAYPEALQVAIRKMLKKRPVDRYQDMGQIIHDLERIKVGKSIMAQGLSGPIDTSEAAAKKALSASKKMRAGSVGAKKRKAGKYDYGGAGKGPEDDLEEDPRAAFSLAKKIGIVTAVVGACLTGILLFKNAEHERVDNLASHMIDELDGIQRGAKGTVLKTVDKPRQTDKNKDRPGSQSPGGDGQSEAANTAAGLGTKAGQDTEVPGHAEVKNDIRATEDLLFNTDADGIIMSNDIYPWKELKELGASDREVKSLQTDDLVGLGKVKGDAQDKLIAMCKNPRWLAEKFYRDGAFHFPSDVFVGAISIDHGTPILTRGTMPAPPGKEVFLYMTTPTKKAPALVDKFGPADLTGIAILYERRDDLQFVLQKIKTWSRLKDLWFFNPLIRIIAKDTDDWGEGSPVDADLPKLNTFKGLRSIGLCYPISGPAILQQSFLRKIEGIALKRVQNVGPLLSELPHLNNIKEVGLYTLDTSDAQLELLAQMKNLQKLTILRGRLTYDSLKSFKKMKGLKELHLDRNDWTREQKDAFKKSLPQCKIVFERVISSYYWPMSADSIERYRRPENNFEP